MLAQCLAIAITIVTMLFLDVACLKTFIYPTTITCLSFTVSKQNDLHYKLITMNVSGKEWNYVRVFVDGNAFAV